jgi:hypothetical protein
LFDVFAIDLVELGTVVGIAQVDVDLDGRTQRGSGGLRDRLHVVERLAGLLLEAAGEACAIGARGVWPAIHSRPDATIA